MGQGEILKLKQKIAVFWFRRDLRLHDNHGLYRALSSGLPVLPVFIFDKAILGKLQSADDARVSFIYSRLQKLKAELESKGSSLEVLHAMPADAFRILLEKYDIQQVFANKDYEPYAIGRDSQVGETLKSSGSEMLLFKDHLIFEEAEVVKENGQPYTVYTPYSNKWKHLYNQTTVVSYPSEKKAQQYLKMGPSVFPLLKDLGFVKSPVEVPEPDFSAGVIENYKYVRDYPAANGTTRLGTHLRFGTVSIREVVSEAWKKEQVFLNELIWREFFSTILWHFPHVEHKAFKPGYEFIGWRNNEQEFARWCSGETGYPIVDAGMRELNATGFMHNRVRMVTAGFLVKHLLVDWRWGEAYLASKLLDYELASNNGNWQWAAGTGCDAAPWFRIFNPDTQQKKFDPRGEYIRKWVPEWQSPQYPAPMVDHREARARALNAYKTAGGN